MGLRLAYIIADVLHEHREQRDKVCTCGYVVDFNDQAAVDLHLADEAAEAVMNRLARGDN